MADSGENIIEFGAFRLDTVAKILRHNGKIASLPLKSIELLCLLAQNQNEVVTKAMILDSVWEDSFVEESVLTQNIYTLRRFFDECGAKGLIKTVPRRGYIFSHEPRSETSITIERDVYEEIEIIEDVAEIRVLPQPTPVSSQFNKIALAASIFLLIVATFLAYWFFNRRIEKVSVSSIRSIAVLPLRSFDREPVDESLRLRLTDSLITKLGTIEAISVRPTSSMLKFVNGDEDSIEIGKRLLVDAILEGSVQREANNIRITLQLVSVKNGQQIWSDQFDGESDRLLDLQNSISANLLARLDLPLSIEQEVLFARRPTSIPEAYEEYLKGRFFWQKRTAESLQNAIAAFQRSIKLDPNFALAHAGLADVYCVLPEYSTSPEKDSYLAAQKHAIRALELDKNLAEALTALAFVEFWNNKNFQESEKNFRRAIKANPNYPTAHHWFGNVLLAKKRLTESIAHLNEAQKLDPLSLVINTELGIACYYLRQNDLAIEKFRQTLQIEPQFHRATIWLGRALTVKGDFNEAIALYKTLPKEIASAGGAIAEIGFTNGIAGSKAEAELHLKTLKLRPATEKNAFSQAIILLGIGDTSRSLEYLKKAMVERESDLAYIDVDPIFDPLRETEDFKRLTANFR